jgi:hypothetical protein
MKTTNGINQDAFSLPLHISDLLSLCKSYHQLGYSIQSQVEMIVEIGIEEAINSGAVDPVALPHIKHFLRSIAEQQLWGEAADIALDCVCLIELYEDKHPPLSIAN